MYGDTKNQGCQISYDTGVAEITRKYFLECQVLNGSETAVGRR